MMDIVLKHITVKDLVDGFVDSDEEGVKGYKGKLNIRPKYQREFVYKDDQAKAVIKTITKGLTVMCFKTMSIMFYFLFIKILQYGRTIFSS